MIAALLFSSAQSFAKMGNLGCDLSLLPFDFANRVAVRGFLGSNPRLDDARALEFSKIGLIGWSISVYVKPSIEAAKNHHDLVESRSLLAKKEEQLKSFEETLSLLGSESTGSVQETKQEYAEKVENLKKEIAQNKVTIKSVDQAPTKPLYLIADIPAHFSEMTKEQKLEWYQGIFAQNKLMFFSRHDQQPVEVTPLQRQIFDLSTVRVMENGILGTVFGNPGWAYPERRGVLKLEEETFKGSTYKKLRNQARNYEKAGDKFVFNSNFQEALETARDQERRGQSVEQSRYRIPAVFKKSMDFYKEGIAFSVEHRDKDNNLLGGLICFRYGNLITIDTVFYKNDIGSAKVAALALIDRLMAAGIKFIDMGMVTSYSESLKAMYVDSDMINPTEFEAMINALPQEHVEIDLSGEWKAPVAGEK